jgi:hypothetical protein
VKIWLVILLFVAAPALAQPPASPGASTPAPSAEEEDELFDWEPALPESSDEVEEEAEEQLIDVPWADDPNDVPINWVDTSHAVVTNRAQALTEWMDAFLGDREYNAEQAESLLRLEMINEWDQDDGNSFRLRLRGKVQLPRVSRRLNLVFEGEDGDAVSEEERREEDRVGLQYKVREGGRSRFDATLNYSSGNIRPGVRYRNENNFSDLTSYRYIQRLQYDSNEEFFTTGNFDINHKLDADAILRWANRIVWGEDTDGVEWRTRLALRERRHVNSKRPLVLSWYGSVNGVTRPDSFVKNYRLGVVWRRQVYRDFLFAEVEPAFNYRRRELEDDREGFWSIVLRLEIALERDLRRVR